MIVKSAPSPCSRSSPCPDPHCTCSPLSSPRTIAGQSGYTADVNTIDFPSGAQIALSASVAIELSFFGVPATPSRHQSPQPRPAARVRATTETRSVSRHEKTRAPPSPGSVPASRFGLAPGHQPEPTASPSSCSSPGPHPSPNTPATSHPAKPPSPPAAASSSGRQTSSAACPASAHKPAQPQPLPSTHPKQKHETASANLVGQQSSAT